MNLVLIHWKPRKFELASLLFNAKAGNEIGFVFLHNTKVAKSIFLLSDLQNDSGNPC